MNLGCKILIIQKLNLYLSQQSGKPLIFELNVYKYVQRKDKSIIE